MDLNNPVVQLCAEGTQAEFDGRIDDAKALYWRAWESARDDFEACVAAHYVARRQQNPADALRWNEVALERANAMADDRVQPFYPSLYVNLGHAHEALGNLDDARRFYKLAAELGLQHQEG
jgi:tetratricopeptide (TPR) repeat protein